MKKSSILAVVVNNASNVLLFSKANILKALDDVCNLLPKTVSTECKDFVKDYGKEILNLLLQSIDPQQICTAIGLCSQNHLQGLSAVVHLIQTKVSDKSGMVIFVVMPIFFPVSLRFISLTADASAFKIEVFLLLYLEEILV